MWGLLLPFFRRAAWFKKHGYKKVDRKGISVLLWKTFSDDASWPRWIRAKKKPRLVPVKVAVTALTNGWCSGADGMMERAGRVSTEFGERVVYREIDSSRRTAVREWGLPAGLFVDGKNIYHGPPLSYEKIKKNVARKVGKLQRKTV